MRSQWFQDDPTRRFTIPPLRTWRGADLLVLALVVTFLLQLAFGLESVLGLRRADLANPLRWYELVTYAFVHSRHDLFHLIINCLLFYFFGRQIEYDLGGRRGFLGFCVVAAVVASLSFVVVEALSGAPGGVTLLGASGMGFACLVAFATLYPQAQVVFFIFPMRAWALAAIFMGIALYTMLIGVQDGVAHPAHLGGGAFGFLFVRYRHVLDRVVERYRLRRESLLRQRSADRRREVDRLLEKISRTGIGSLTRAERRFLDVASRDLRDRH